MLKNILKSTLGLVIFLALPLFSHAAYTASDLVGQLNVDTPVYTTAGSNNAPNNRGFSFPDQDIEQQDYRTDKSQLVSEKKTFEEKISLITNNQNSWLEPYTQWLKEAQNLGEITHSPELHAKKSIAKKIFGSNLTLTARQVQGAPQKQWASITEAHQKISQIGFCLTMVGPEGIELSTW